MSVTEVFPWQQEQWRQLGGLLEQDVLPHALMFAGPAEIGKHSFAMAFAQTLLCATPADWRACGNCKTCKLFEAATHPDFIRIAPAEEGKVIPVDRIRELGEFASRTASMGGRRVILIEPAEAMNINAANAFLKTLEEPGADVCIILVVHQPGRILPTIRSRCRIFPFSLPPAEPVRQWLQARAGDGVDIAQVMELSGGRPLRALRLLDSDLKDQLQVFRDTLSQVEAGILPVLDGAKAIQSLAKGDAIEWFQYLLYDRLRDAAQRRHPQARLLFRFLDRLTTLRQRLLSTANPNPQLIWEEILMDWKSVIDLYQTQGTQAL
ncbi:MAG: DNA polymerase III subunit delta' [Porticoccaceae bacterium]